MPTALAAHDWPTKRDKTIYVESPRQTRDGLCRRIPNTSFIDLDQMTVIDDGLASDNDASNRRSGGAVDKIGYWIEERKPLRSCRVEQHDIRQFPHLDTPKVVRSPDGAS